MDTFALLGIDAVKMIIKLSTVPFVMAVDAEHLRHP